MTAITDLDVLIRSMHPVLNEGSYVFCSVHDLGTVSLQDILCFFKEKEGTTVILKKEIADAHLLPYTFVASWITLSVHSSLEAVGLTAAFSKALADKGISCNVVAAFYHDHIFIAKEYADKAMKALLEFIKIY